jgi:uncharacterized protein (DUF433 family)
MFGNPTMGNTRLTVAKIWAMVSDKKMETLLDEYPLTLGEINSALEFVDWCRDLGLIEEHAGNLHYDKDALYAAANLGDPPKGKLCYYCRGFISEESPIWTDFSERPEASSKLKIGVCHGICLQAILSAEQPPMANVHPSDLNAY